MYPVNLAFVFLNKKLYNKIIITRPAKTRGDPSFPFVIKIESDASDDVVEVLFDKQMLTAVSGCSLDINQEPFHVPQMSFLHNEYHDFYVKDLKRDLTACGFPEGLFAQYTIGE
jgi:hypothetical protein